MGFDSINEEQKVRISLSRRAYNVLLDDMEIFKVDRPATFINTVMENFREDSKASLTSYLEHKKDQISAKLDKALMDPDSKEKAIEHLYKQEKEEVINTLNDFMKEKAISHIYHINNNNRDYLEFDCVDEHFYRYRPGMYIKCILEEYASLPYIEREKIYRKDVFDTVLSACSNKRLMQVRVVSNGERKTLLVYPYKIVADDMNMQSYLACYTIEQGQSSKEKRTASFTMARMQKPTILKQNAFLSKEEQKKIEDDIEKLSISFLFGDEKEIHVRLTEYGKKSFQTRIYSRPAKDNEMSTEDEYVFHCSENQAYFYFYSFGQNVEILSPASLRNRFIESHKKALCIYEE